MYNNKIRFTKPPVIQAHRDIDMNTLAEHEFIEAEIQRVFSCFRQSKFDIACHEDFNFNIVEHYVSCAHAISTELRIETVPIEREVSINKTVGLFTDNPRLVNFSRAIQDWFWDCDLYFGWIGDALNLLTPIDQTYVERHIEYHHYYGGVPVNYE